jgi:hypothetical protein
MVLQRQWRAVPAIELLFKEVLRFKVVPSPEKYEGSIWAAKLHVDRPVVF